MPKGALALIMHASEMPDGNHWQKVIAKEAVNNLVKYSGCKNATILFSLDRHLLVAEIQDDGQGFDISAPTSRNGLQNMKARAEKIRGKLEIGSSQGKGTSIRLEVKC